jgi:hypothetical protein
MDRPRLDVEIYQIADDSMLKQNRSDGTGWDWSWSEWQRDWMDATPHRYAYRCLPLTIMNQTGWWIRNPVGFTATWRGQSQPGTVDFRFDVAPNTWDKWINCQFGEGIITWNTPFLFRTKPVGSRLLICGPANYFKPHVQPLSALIESDWVTMSFTMNWKIMVPDQPIRFELGEPLFQAIPLASNVCADLEDASVSYQRLRENPELLRAYQEWDQGRRRFHEQKVSGDVKPNDWQKDYFQGRDAIGQAAAGYHMTKVKPPPIRTNHPAAEPPRDANAAPVAAGSVASSAVRNGNGATVRRTSSSVINPASDERTPEMFQFQVCLNMATAEPAQVTEQTLLVTNPNGDAAHHERRAQQACPVGTVHSAGETPGRLVDDEWRRWIAENLMTGQPPDSILEAMKSSGFPPEHSLEEINLALESPYLKGSKLLLDRLKKRDWQLAVYRKCNRLHPASAEIEHRHKLSRNEFLHEYYSTNRPVIITGMMDDWPALKKWNLDFFAEKFGERLVEVQMGRTTGANYETEQEKYSSKIRFGDFVEKVRSAGETNDFYLTAKNNSSNKSVLAELWDDIVQIPEYLARNERGGFFWMGPRGTITPFHHDLTNNFMAQVIGRKRIKLAPSWDISLMRNYLHCFSGIDGRTAHASPRPRLDEPQILEFMLHPGEILFLPIGCLHYVEGVDISVTVSFTNFVFDNDFSSFYTTYGPV